MSPHPVFRPLEAKHDNLRGIALMVIAGVLFAAMQAGIRHVTNSGLHAFEAAFFRNLFGLIVIVPWFFRYGLSVLRTERIGLHALRAMINGASMLIFFYAMTMTPLAQITALNFTTPIFATVFAVILLRERVGWRQWLAIFTGFAGALMVVRPGFAEIGLGPVLAIGASLGYGIVVLIVKVISRTESSVTTTAYFSLLMAPVTLVPSLFVWQWPDLETLLWLVGIGVVGNIGQILFAQALRIGDTSIVMPFDFVKLFWVASLAYVFFAEVPDAFVWIGGAVIFGAGAYIAYRARRHPEPPAGS